VVSHYLIDDGKEKGPRKDEKSATSPKFRSSVDMTTDDRTSSFRRVRSSSDLAESKR